MLVFLKGNQQFCLLFGRAHNLFWVLVSSHNLLCRLSSESIRNTLSKTSRLRVSWRLRRNFLGDCGNACATRILGWLRMRLRRNYCDFRCSPLILSYLICLVIKKCRAFKSSSTLRRDSCANLTFIFLRHADQSIKIAPIQAEKIHFFCSAIWPPKKRGYWLTCL